MIFRSKIEDLIIEFSPPANRAESIATIIICDGLPSVPKQKELISYLSGKGFFVIYPRYRGTWESGGEFLENSPTLDIEEVIQHIQQYKLKELYADNEFTANKKSIFLIGSSFGGTVALSLADNVHISKVIALSPIVDFTRHNENSDEQDLLWLGEFITKAFNQGYRFKKNNWLKMAKGQIFNPSQELDKNLANKILILYNKEDKEVNYNKIEKYCSLNQIESITLEGIGHISFSKVTNSAWDKIIHWLLKKKN